MYRVGELDAIGHLRVIRRPPGTVLFGGAGALIRRLGVTGGMRSGGAGCIPAARFTLSLAVASAAFAWGPVQDAARVSGPFSLLTAVIRLPVAKGIRARQRGA